MVVVLVLVVGFRVSSWACGRALAGVVARRIGAEVGSGGLAPF